VVGRHLPPADAVSVDAGHLARCASSILDLFDHATSMGAYQGFCAGYTGGVMWRSIV